jgi:hypothetical protein
MSKPSFLLETVGSTLAAAGCFMWMAFKGEISAVGGALGATMTGLIVYHYATHEHKHAH